MIIKKPYAFLIKHFKKVHIFLLALCCFIYYINSKTMTFINEFMQLGSYDSYSEPITKYLSPLTFLVLIALIGISICLLMLLKKKEKPWKLYLVPVIGYVLMMIVYLMFVGFFDTYDGNLEQAVFRTYKDLLSIVTIIQFPSMFIFLMRIICLDINKFNFKVDEEYLELSNDDKDELEINIDFDPRSIKRNSKKLLRNMNYVYQEHKLIFNCVFAVIFLILLKNTYNYIFVTNKAYSMGDTFYADGYEITLKNSYYTDKDYNGKVISKHSHFVVVDLSIKNLSKARDLDLNLFHVMNGVNDYTYTAKTFGTEFQDYGETYKTKKLKNNESLDMILVFKVDSKLSKRRFVLYYQELNNGNIHLRKIKLNLNDVSEIKENKKIYLGDEFTFKVKNKKETIIFDSLNILETTEYTYRICNTSECNNLVGIYTAPKGYKIMKLGFASETYEGKDMIDFSSKYGKINYIDNKNKVKSVEIKNPLGKTYYGKYLYVKVPEELETSTSIEIEYIIRNNKYVYKVR